MDSVGVRREHNSPPRISPASEKESGCRNRRQQSRRGSEDGTPGQRLAPPSTRCWPWGDSPLWCPSAPVCELLTRGPRGGTAVRDRTPCPAGSRCSPLNDHLKEKLDVSFWVCDSRPAPPPGPQNTHEQHPQSSEASGVTGTQGSGAPARPSASAFPPPPPRGRGSPGTPSGRDWLRAARPVEASVNARRGHRNSI